MHFPMNTGLRRKDDGRHCCLADRREESEEGLGNDAPDSSPPFSGRAGVGMTECAAESWQFCFRSNDKLEPGQNTGCLSVAVHSKSQ